MRSEISINVTSDTWESEVIDCNTLVMVFFWAQWCDPCLKMSKTIEAMAADIPEKVKIVKVNIDDNDDIASDYKVSIVPTTMFFKEGRKCRELITNVSRKQLEDVINLI